MVGVVLISPQSRKARFRHSVLNVQQFHNSGWSMTMSDVFDQKNNVYERTQHQVSVVCRDNE